MCQALERDFGETDKGDRISSIWRKNARTSQGHTAIKERIMQHEKDRFFQKLAQATQREGQFIVQEGLGQLQNRGEPLRLILKIIP